MTSIFMYRTVRVNMSISSWNGATEQWKYYHAGEDGDAVDAVLGFDHSD